MRALRTVLTAAVLTVAMTPLALPADASTLPVPGREARGYDVSWPQCSRDVGIPGRRGLGLPMPLPDAQFVIVGLTNGPAFTPNPCLASQVAWTRARHLWAGAYAITTFPSATELTRHGGTGTRAQRLERVGRAQSAFNLRTMRAAGLAAPMVWVDVEPNSLRPWSRSTVDNNAVITGVVRGLQAAGIRVGLYSYASGWRTITGGRQFPGVPTWVPAGTTDLTAARAKCRTASFSGGPVWLGQWTDGVRDFNITCPGVTGRASTLHPTTPYASTKVRLGSRGPAVAALQRTLRISADGVFGRQTHASVVAFQRSKRLVADGIVGPVTWRALGAGSGVPGVPGVFRSAFAST